MTHVDIDKSNIHFKRNLRVYFGFIKKYKAKIIALLLLTFLIEGSYILSKYFFKIIVDDGTKFAANEITSGAYVRVLIIIAIAYIILTLFRAGAGWVNTNLLIKTTTSTKADIKRKFFDHIVHLSHKFHTSHKTGSLISRLIRGSGGIESMNDVVIFSFAPAIFQGVIIIASLFYLNLASAVTMIIVSAIFITVNLMIHEKSKPYGDIYNKKEDLEKAFVSDIMTNIDSVKNFGKEKLIKSKFKTASETTKKAESKFWGFFRTLEFFQAFLLGIGTFLLVYFPILAFLEGEITMGSIVFIYSIYGNMVHALYRFVHGTRAYYRAMIDFEALFEYGEEENDIKDKLGAKNLEIRKGSIEFKNVDFKYNKNKLFQDYNLEIKPNEKVALVGHSGCGKTTLMKLLYRLYDVDRGQILIDGKDIKDVRQESLRSELSIVPQEAVLFDDTIYNNIAFSNPSATRNQVFAAMKFAQLDKIVANFPDKEKTIVGERGVKLSGGEKQRVSIARAILANKKVLLLDEATSALDSQTEYDIQQDLKRLMQGRTSIIIAHRLSTIMHADKIVVMDKGKIVQVGKHNRLIRQQGEYRKLWKLQKGGYIK